MKKFYNTSIGSKSVFSLLFLLLISIAGYNQTQTQNNGNLYIQPNAEMCVFNALVNNTGSTLNIKGLLHLRNNFTNDGITTSSSGTTYFDSNSFTTQILNGSSGTAQFYNLSVNNTTPSVNGLSVASGFKLEVTNNMDISNGKLRLLGTAQLLQTHTGVSTNTGNGSLLVDQNGARNAYRYNFWSSPVHYYAGSTYATHQVLRDGTTPDQFLPQNLGFTAAYDGVNTTTPVKVSTRWMWKYVNSPLDSYNANWKQLFNMGTTNPSAEASLSPGEGYTMKGTQASSVYEDWQNYTFEGKPNDGDYQLTISPQKEYLMGNPYPSALDANDFINDNIGKIDGSLYFWEHWSTDTHVYANYGGGYATYNLSGGLHPASLDSDFTGGSRSGSITPKRYIPVGQGFMVRAEIGNGGTIQFNNAQRAFKIEGDNSVFFRTAANSNDNVEDNVIARIRLEYNAPVEGNRHLLLAFTNGAATDLFDFGYDARIIDLNPNDIFFEIANSENYFPYCIQGVGVFDETKMYPLTFNSGTTGVHKIKLSSTENFPHNIYILDTHTLTTHLLNQSDYEVDLEIGIFSNRFKLVFQPSNPLEVIDVNDAGVLGYYFNENLIIKNLNNLKIHTIKASDMLGKIILNKTISSNDAFITIPFNNSEAIYMLSVETEKGISNLKFIKM